MEKNEETFLMSKITKKYREEQTFLLFIMGLLLGIVLNLSANVLYDRLIRDHGYAENIVLILTAVVIYLVFYAYKKAYEGPRVKLEEELKKLQESR